MRQDPKEVNSSGQAHISLFYQKRGQTLSTIDVRRTFVNINLRKAAGQGNIPGRMLRDCADQLFKKKKQNPDSLNDFRPLALMPTMTTCFEHLVVHHMKSCLLATLNLLQFAYRANRSADVAWTSWQRDAQWSGWSPEPEHHQNIRDLLKVSSLALFSSACSLTTALLLSNNRIIKYADDVMVVAWSTAATMRPGQR